MQTAPVLPEYLFALVPACGEASAQAWMRLAHSLLETCGGAAVLEKDPVRTIRFAQAVSLLLMGLKIEARIYAALDEPSAVLPAAALVGQAAALRREAAVLLEALQMSENPETPTHHATERPASDEPDAQDALRLHGDGLAASDAPGEASGAALPATGVRACQEESGCHEICSASVRADSATAADRANSAIPRADGGAPVAEIPEHRSPTLPAGSASAGLTRQQFMEEVRRRMADPVPLSGDDTGPCRNRARQEKIFSTVRQWVNLLPPALREPMPVRPIRIRPTNRPPAAPL